MKNNKKKSKMHLKKGDNVRIICGKEKGKTGKITEVFLKRSKIIVSNVNMATKHIKPNADKANGRIVSIEMPIHSSKAMIYSKK